MSGKVIFGIEEDQELQKRGRTGRRRGRTRRRGKTKRGGITTRGGEARSRERTRRR